MYASLFPDAGVAWLTTEAKGMQRSHSWGRPCLPFLHAAEARMLIGRSRKYALRSPWHFGKCDVAAVQETDLISENKCYFSLNCTTD